MGEENVVSLCVGVLVPLEIELASLPAVGPARRCWNGRCYQMSEARDGLPTNGP